jgi:hypothetical protein
MDIMSLSDALAAATTEVENLRAAIQKVWSSQFDSVISLHIIIPQRSSLKGILLWNALFVKWYSGIYTGQHRLTVFLNWSTTSFLRSNQECMFSSVHTWDSEV